MNGAVALTEAVEQYQITKAKALLAEGIYSIEQIAKLYDLPVEMVRKLAGEIGA